MAKDNRKINSAVRFGGVLYKEGMEDELEAAMTAEQITRLTERGAIEGSFKGAAKATATETAATTTAEKGKAK
jgi:hypothetical protein